MMLIVQERTVVVIIIMLKIIKFAFSQCLLNFNGYFIILPLRRSDLNCVESAVKLQPILHSVTAFAGKFSIIIFVQYCFYRIHDALLLLAILFTHNEWRYITGDVCMS